MLHGADAHGSACMDSFMGPWAELVSGTELAGANMKAGAAQSVQAGR